MALNYIWVGFIIIGFLVALLRAFGYLFRDFFADKLGVIFDAADLQVFSAMVDSTFDMAKTSVDISIYLIGVMTLWLGIMKIGEKGGAINAIGKVVNPFFKKLFPEVPENHPAMGSMLMNFAANMLGLDNAATPLGLKAMNELQELNKKKDTASNGQIMFIVLNTSGLTIIPVSIMAIRASMGAANPADVFVPLILATFFSSLAGLIAVSVVQKINLFNKVIIGYIGFFSLLIVALIMYINRLEQEQIASITRFSGHFLIMLIIVGFIVLGIRRKINIYEAFIEGAKEGFKVSIGIIPYLVAMLVAIGIFRASGTMELLISGFRGFFSIFNINTEFVDALPTAFMKPLSGSGARGMMVDAINTFGVDSFVGRLASTFQGSTETTFYTLAVYYGAVKIKNTRYTVSCGLIADLAGMIAAIFIAYIFY